MRSLIRVTALSILLLTAVSARGQDCVFDEVKRGGGSFVLRDSCTLTRTMELTQNGTYLCPNGKVITLVDPDGGNFMGPAFQKNGGSLTFTRCTVHADRLKPISECPTGSNRLAIIELVNVSAEISRNHFFGPRRQTPAGCEEGVAIYVRGDRWPRSKRYVYVKFNQPISGPARAGIVAESGRVVAWRNEFHVEAAPDKPVNGMECNGAYCLFSDNSIHVAGWNSGSGVAAGIAVSNAVLKEPGREVGTSIGDNTVSGNFRFGLYTENGGTYTGNNIIGGGLAKFCFASIGSNNELTNNNLSGCEQELFETPAVPDGFAPARYPLP